MYEANIIQENKVVAVKHIICDFTSPSHYHSNEILSEMNLLRKMSNGNIVPLIAIFFSKRRSPSQRSNIFIAMEKCGQDLRGYIKKKVDGFREKEIATILKMLLNGKESAD